MKGQTTETWGGKEEVSGRPEDEGRALFAPAYPAHYPNTGVPHHFDATRQTGWVKVAVFILPISKWNQLERLNEGQAGC